MASTAHKIEPIRRGKEHEGVAIASPPFTTHPEVTDSAGRVDVAMHLMHERLADNKGSNRESLLELTPKDINYITKSRSWQCIFHCANST
jgi:hypothetical protein